MTINEPEFSYRGTYDENWPLPEQLTLEQYRHVIFRPDAHFVDGRIVQRELGEFDHSQAVGALIGTLGDACRKTGACCCVSLRLQVTPIRVRVCDFVVLKQGAPREPVPTVPPLLCVEVLASSQTPADELEILADYLAMGVENIWLVDPIRQAAFIFDAEGLHEADSADLTVPDTEIRANLTDLFAAMD